MWMAFIPMNVAKLALGDESGFVPCTPLGCQRLLIESGIEISGAHVVVLGRSMIVGKPLALLLMRKGEAATRPSPWCIRAAAICAEITRSADILIAAIGQPQFVQSGTRARRRGGHRRRNQSRGRRDDASAATGWSATSPSRSRAKSCRDHAGPRRRRPDDDRDADVEHGQGVPPNDS